MMLKVRIVERKYDYKMGYNFTYFIYLKDSFGRTVTHTFINSYARLNKDIISDFIHDNIKSSGLYVLDLLYDKIDSFLYSGCDFENWKISIKDNKELLIALS